MFTKSRTAVEDFFAGGNIIYTDQCENLSDYYFSAAETGVCDFVQTSHPPEIFPHSLPSAPSTCLDSEGKLCSLRVWLNQMQQGLEPALLFCQITFTGTVFTMGSGNVDLQAQKSKTHIYTTEPDCVLRFRVSLFLRNDIVLQKHFFCVVLRLSTSHFVYYCQKKCCLNNKVSACL